MRARSAELSRGRWANYNATHVVFIHQDSLVVSVVLRSARTERFMASIGQNQEHTLLRSARLYL